MTATGRRARLAAALVVFGLLLAGTVVGDDDHFPFGPFRMYASTLSPDADTTWVEVEAVDASGEQIFVAPADLGLRRAELEGGTADYRNEPARLAELADAWARWHPDAPPLRSVTLVERRQPMDDGEPAGAVATTVMATWAAP